MEGGAVNVASESEQIMQRNDGWIYRSPLIDICQRHGYEGFRFRADHGNESNDRSIDSIDQIAMEI